MNSAIAVAPVPGSKLSRALLHIVDPSFDPKSKREAPGLEESTQSSIIESANGDTMNQEQVLE